MSTADRDALADLVGAVERHDDLGGGVPQDVLDAVARARRHLDRVGTPKPRHIHAMCPLDCKEV